MSSESAKKDTLLWEPIRYAIATHMTDVASMKQPISGPEDGDVLALVYFPKEPTKLACDGKPWPEVIKIRMKSERLLSLDSPKIKEMLGDRMQARFRRRLKNGPGLDEFRYIIDFTPPVEGQELAEITAALWLPKMVKLWWLAGMFIPDEILEVPHLRGLPDFPMRPLANRPVGPLLVLGHDDVCRSRHCVSRPPSVMAPDRETELVTLGITNTTDWKAKQGVPGIVDDDEARDDDRGGYMVRWRRVEDYCPVRHRATIVRVLRAINGDNLWLNSAVRMWTVAQVGLWLEVPQVVVSCP